MERSKPQRRTNIFNYWPDCKRYKPSELSSRSVKIFWDESYKDYSLHFSETKQPITNFEILPNEIIYEIFQYLEIHDTYKAFSNLNMRLQDFLTSSGLPWIIRISSMSKSNFQSYHRQIIIPNKHQIVSIHLANPFVVDTIFSPVHIASHLTRLETLVFDNIKSKYLVNILHHLASLPRLVSLTIIPIDFCRNIHRIYQNILSLKALKYCKIQLKTRWSYEEFSHSISTKSALEHLVIMHALGCQRVISLLSCVPQLKRLRLDGIDGHYPHLSENSTVASTIVTHLTININSTGFIHFGSMIKNLFPLLEVLHILVKNNRQYLDADQWERIITSALPRLRIFDLYYSHAFENNIECNQSTCEAMLRAFSSLFWFQHKWYFEYQLTVREYGNSMSFFSLNPYRRKQYFLQTHSGKNNRPCNETNNTNSVNHVHVQEIGNGAISKNKFRNATELTFSHGFKDSRQELHCILKHAIPLTKLTTLNILTDSFTLYQLIHLLRSAPNIHTLKFDWQSIDQNQYHEIQQSDMFRSVSSTNKIRKLTIESNATSKILEVCTALCPNMEYLTIRTRQTELESSIRFVLSTIKTSTQHLNLICIQDSYKRSFTFLKNLIESEELLNNYLMKRIDAAVYIWW